MYPDFKELLSVFNTHKVKYLIVGRYLDRSYGIFHLWRRFVEREARGGTAAGHRRRGRDPQSGRKERLALLMAQSRRPKRATVPATRASISVCWRTSVRMNRPCPPKLSICRTTASLCSVRRASMATFAPSRANRSAVAAPIPELPPVMSMTLSLNDPVFYVPSLHCCAVVLGPAAQWYFIARHSIAPCECTDFPFGHVAFVYRLERDIHRMSVTRRRANALSSGRPHPWLNDTPLRQPGTAEIEPCPVLTSRADDAKRRAARSS